MQPFSARWNWGGVHRRVAENVVSMEKVLGANLMLTNEVAQEDFSPEARGPREILLARGDHTSLQASNLRSAMKDLE